MSVDEKWFDEVCKRLCTAAGVDWADMDEPSIEDMEYAIKESIKTTVHDAIVGFNKGDNTKAWLESLLSLGGKTSSIEELNKHLKEQASNRCVHGVLSPHECKECENEIPDIEVEKFKYRMLEEKYDALLKKYESLCELEEQHPDGYCDNGHPPIRFWTQRDDGKAMTCPLCPHIDHGAV